MKALICLLLLWTSRDNGVDGFCEMNPIFDSVRLITRKNSALNPISSSITISEVPAKRGNFFSSIKAPRVTIKGKTINAWGVLYALSVFGTAAIVLPFMLVIAGLSDLFGNRKQRRLIDWIVHVWAKVSMRLAFCSPALYGSENLPPLGETVVYVPNHTSFVDILVLSGFIPRPFKYLSKSEIGNIPLVGWGMQLAQHVFLKRGDLKSTLEVSDNCIQKLSDGNSMVLFAEGTRSEDGSLKSFKKGAFQMAQAAGVRVVPVSVGNLNLAMPKNALLPIAPINKAFIRIHPPIGTKDKPVSQIRDLCHEAVNAGLPESQKASISKKPGRASDGDATTATAIFSPSSPPASEVSSGISSAEFAPAACDLPQTTQAANSSGANPQAPSSWSPSDMASSR